MEVHLHDLVFRRPSRFCLDVPELRIPRGSVTAVLGPNGSGKTTLLRLVAGLESPDRGVANLDGSAATTVASRRVSYAFQEAVFFSGTVRENLALALRLRGIQGADAGARIEEVARDNGTEELLDANARRLSGGEAQRVNLARALSLRAPLTLLDEPLAQLDGAVRARILDELPDLFRRFTQTVLLVTHANDEALRLADRLVVLVDGRVRAYAEKKELLEHPSDPRVAELLGFVVLSSLRGLVAVRPATLAVGDGAVTFTMSVRRVVDLLHGREVLGTVEGTRVAALLPPGVGAPAPGASIQIATDAAIPLSG